MERRRGRRAVVYTAAAVLALFGAWWPSSAAAGGIASARFGGEHGNASETNPTALYYNPGGIALSEGTHLMLDGTFIFRNVTYTRSPGAIDASTFQGGRSAGLSRESILAANAGENDLDNFLISPMLGATTDFGLEESPFRVGVAYFVPFGGVSVWDRAAPVEGIPGAADGTARWYTIDGSVRTDAVVLGLGYELELGEQRIGLGLTGNLYRSILDTIRARTPDSTDNVHVEGRSLLDVSSTDFGFGVGVLWEPLPDALWVGLSYQSRPNLDGDVVMDGTLLNSLNLGSVRSRDDVRFRHRLPDIVRMGIRWRPLPVVELRLVGSLTRWSAMQQQCLAQSTVDDLDRACETRSDGSLAHEEYEPQVNQVFQRRWEDTLAVGVGGSYWLVPALELLGGVGYDGNAVPDRTLDPAFPDAPKLGFSLGARYRVHPSLRLMLTASEVLYFDRDTDGAPSNDGFALPSRQPGAQGRYEQNIFLLNANAEVMF